MEIAILGGTGDVGQGLVLRLGRDTEHDLVVGSRSASRAADAAVTYREELAARSDADLEDVTIEGRANEAAVETADVVVLAVPPAHLRGAVMSVAEHVPDDVILVSPAVTLEFDGVGVHYHRPELGSLTAVAADAAPPSVSVVGTFHTLAARRLADLDRSLEVDALVVGNDRVARQIVAMLVTDVDGLRALDAGPLANAGAVEGLAAVQITLERKNDDLRDPGVRFE